MTKDKVFAIMGKYYGNAYYRNAIRYGWSEHDLQLVTEVLNRINTLGYNFSNLGRLSYVMDIRFIPIVLEYWNKFQSENFRMSILFALHFKEYHFYTPTVLELYRNEQDEEMLFRISDVLYAMRNRKYIPQYLEIVHQASYGHAPDMIMSILCQFHVREAMTRLLELLALYPSVWSYTFLKYVYQFKDPSLLPYVLPYLECDDAEYRRMARKAKTKLVDCKQNNS